jgi:two-component system copper resistance phosphate regulon response regulator CusR
MNELRLLVLEDEPKVGAFLKEGLEEQGYIVNLVTDGILGKVAVEKSKYDMAILDVLVPHINGLELCSIIREKDKSIPILMLTALGTTENKLKGFESGADDYLVKPFEFEELLARIKALTRRGAESLESANMISAFGLSLDLDKKRANRGGQTISLTGKEFGLLEYLMKAKGRVVSKEEISDKVWGVNFDTGTNFVEVYINLLRKKVDKDFDQKLLHTRFGLGYCFTDKP